jgi:hypothetical protein
MDFQSYVPLQTTGKNDPDINYVTRSHWFEAAVLFVDLRRPMGP